MKRLMKGLLLVAIILGLSPLAHAFDRNTFKTGTSNWYEFELRSTANGTASTGILGADLNLIFQKAAYTTLTATKTSQNLTTGDGTADGQDCDTNPATSAASPELFDVCEIGNGSYKVFLSSAFFDTLGYTTIKITHDAGTTNPVDDLVITEAFFPWEMAARFPSSGTLPITTSTMDSNITQLLGSAIATPTVAGVLEVDQTHIRGGLVPATFATGIPFVAVQNTQGAIPANAWSVQGTITDDNVATRQVVVSIDLTLNDEFNTGYGLRVSSAGVRKAYTCITDTVAATNILETADDIAALIADTDDFTIEEDAACTLRTALVLDGAVYQFTANSLELGPGGGVSFPTNFSSLSIDGSGRVLLQPTQTGVTIPTVTTVGTLTTYTGNTPQTGDSFARIGATGSGLTSLASQASVTTIDDFVDTEIDAIKTKTDFLPSVIAGGTGGLFIAGTNAATTITTGLTTHFIGTVDTVTTYTGNTPQTGDSFARIGATGSGLTSLASQASVTAIGTNVSTLLTRIPDTISLANINIEVDTALNTVVPSSNTANSINDILLDQLVPRLPGSGTISTLTTADNIGINAGDVTNGPLAVNVTTMEGITLSGLVGDNFNTFFQDGGATTTKILEDVGGGGGGTTDWTATERSQIRFRLGLDGTTATPSASPTLPVSVGTGGIVAGSFASGAVDNTAFNVTENLNMNNSAADTTLLTRVPDTISLANINTEVGNRMNTVIPSSNTANSIYDVLLDQLVPRLPGSGTISTLTTADNIGVNAGDITNGPLPVNVTAIEGITLSSKVGENLNTFFQNGGLDTTIIVDDVGTGGGGGSGDWTTTEKNQIRFRLGLDGTTATPTATPSLGTVTAQLDFAQACPGSPTSGTTGDACKYGADSVAQTGDSFARIGATGSGLTSLASQTSVTIIDDFVDAEVAAILADTTNLKTRVPAALVSGRMDSVIGAYATGQDPATLLLVTPANKIATNASNQVVASSVQGAVTGTVGGVAGDVTGKVLGGGAGSIVGIGANVNTVSLEGIALSGKAGDNFNVVFQNGGLDTVVIVDDMEDTGGGGGGGSGDSLANTVPGVYVTGTGGKNLGELRIVNYNVVDLSHAEGGNQNPTTTSIDTDLPFTANIAATTKKPVVYFPSTIESGDQNPNCNVQGLKTDVTGFNTSTKVLTFSALPVAPDYRCVFRLGN